MNKYEEALKMFEEYVNFLKENTLLSWKDLDYANKQVEALKELVDKATPKKPIVTRIVYKKLQTWVDYVTCPTCGAAVGYGRCCQNNECRQELDWSEIRV